MDHSCAADPFRWKWPVVCDFIHSLALGLSDASRSSSQGLRQSRTREENTHVCLHYTTSALPSRMHCCQRPTAMFPPRGEEEAGYMWQMKRAMYGTRRASRLFQEHMKGVLKEAGYVAPKVCHQVYHCLETDSMAAIHGDDIIAEGEPGKTEAIGRGQSTWQSCSS